MLNMPADIVQDTDNGLSAAVVNWVEPFATDNSAFQTLTSSHSPGSTFQIGFTSVEYKSVDANGNTAIRVFVIHVRGKLSLYLLLFYFISFFYTFFLGGVQFQGNE